MFSIYWSASGYASSARSTSCLTDAFTSFPATAAAILI
jgi:hypothetical protein